MPKARSELPRWSAEEFARRVLGSEADAAGEAPPAPPVTTLVLFDRGTPDDQRTAAVLAAAATEHADRLRAAAVPATDALPRLQAWQDARRSVDSFDFRRWPAVGVFRRGRLVTTFHPRQVFFPGRLQEREEREQLEIFLAKMVYYDPAQVKEQKGLDMEAEA